MSCYHYWKPLIPCAEICQQNRKNLSEKLVLSANRQANPVNGRMIEKIKLPVGFLTKLISLLGFF
jgi:hypothetical protein